MGIAKSANLALRFLLELCALAALGYWGYQIGQSPLAKVALAVVAPLVAAVVWGVFIAPRATVQVPTWLWLALQALVFGAAIAGLLATGRSILAAAFVLALAVNAVLLYAWRQ
jgi:hypothetical protein